MTREHQQTGEEPVEGIRAISFSVARLAQQLGLGDSLGLSAVFSRWEDVVGDVLAAHTRPERLRDGELVVLVDEPVWATEVRFLSETIVAKCNERAGQHMVDTVTVRVSAFPSDRQGSGNTAAGPRNRGEFDADGGPGSAGDSPVKRAGKTAWNVGRKPRQNRPE